MTLISVIGIGFGVFALTAVLSVTNGFEAEFQNRILGLYPHLVVHPRSSRFDTYRDVIERVRATDGVIAASPVTADEMMVGRGVYRAGATIQGIDLETVTDVIDVEEIMVTGSLDALADTAVVERRGDTVEVRDAGSGAWLTLVVSDGGHEVHVEDRTQPDAGHVRVRLLDLRAQPKATELRPRAGPAVENYGRRDPVPFGSASLGYSKPLELPAGRWELGATGEQLNLDEGTLVTVVLGADPAEPNASLMMRDERRVALPEREARLRVLDARSAGGSLTTVDLKGQPVGPTTSPGEFTDFMPLKTDLPGIVLGSELGKRLKADVGDEITLVTPLRGIDNKMLGPYGMLPSSAHFRVVGTFSAGFHEHDAKIALINLAVAQRFLNRGNIVTFVAVKTNDLLNLQPIKSRLVGALDPYPAEQLMGRAGDLHDNLREAVKGGGSDRPIVADGSFLGGIRAVTRTIGLLRFQGQSRTTSARYMVFDWMEKNINLFSALKLQKVVLSMFFLIIIFVGSFVVVGSQIMVVHEKTREIAILKAMGATRGAIRLVFTLQGLFVALVGALSGLAAGLLLVWLIDVVDYKLDKSIYLIEQLPARVAPLELTLIAIGALLCTLITTQLSAGRAANKHVVDGLRAID